MSDTGQEQKLPMYGGIWGGLIPLLILIFVLFLLSISGQGGTKPFWTAGWLSISLGIFLAKDKNKYCLSVIRGLGNKNGIVIVTAWLFAGVFGKLMVAGGLVDGLLWFGLETGTTGALFALMSFFAAMLFSVGTGTSVGTVLALIPVLYPAGIYLGANPPMLAVGILSGAAFGDNLAPISDTTIVSAFTQEAEIRDVVRSRFPLAICAAIISATVILVFGGGGEIRPLPEIEAQTNPAGLVMLFSFAAVVVFALLKRHLIESLIYGNIIGILLGLITRQLNLATIFHIPGSRGDSTGIIQDGINGVAGAIIFAMLMLAITQILIDSGVLKSILNKLQTKMIKTVRKAELSIIFITIIATIPVAANAAAELLVGPSIVNPLGKRFNLAPARKANLMDCSVCTIFYTLPWAIVVVVWYSAISTTAKIFDLPELPIGASFLNPYSWALLIIIIFSALTGWNRKYDRVSNG